jgi:hypothetical protein
MKKVTKSALAVKTQIKAGPQGDVEMPPAM